MAKYVEATKQAAEFKNYLRLSDKSLDSAKKVLEAIANNSRVDDRSKFRYFVEIEFTEMRDIHFNLKMKRQGKNEAFFLDPYVGSFYREKSSVVFNYHHDELLSTDNAVSLLRKIRTSGFPIKRK
jgi:hypothetical protein